ncbi:hypothetical protein [Actinomadura rubrisoli]|uniref:Uncharacterized protein n=1 Tax=Actinomadura rubrisoli TaxID=2530368 RepID=A0A4V2YVS0_9ACTN|nr:hypothetical protein [Actinomadura rubrisoli]TDD82627.1 hypothetical protein E1298_22435 [Actinomadura rubrisoli]
MERLARALAGVSVDLADERAKAARIHQAYKDAMLRHGLLGGTVQLITASANEWLAANVPTAVPLIIAAPTDPPGG